jgi:phosphatidylglycerol:prolipoprotein diacylglycerol transferase
MAASISRAAPDPERTSGILPAVLPALIDVIPSAGLDLGPVRLGFYGIGFVVAISVMILVSRSEARHKGADPALVTSAVIVVAIFALVGARLYHVVGEWQTYQDDPLRAILPPYAGLGLYGGIIGAAIGIWVFLRGRGIPLSRALDIVVPGTLFAQGIARWGNFFNQELYGPPTDLPWGLVIDCAHRIEPWLCAGDPRLGAGAAFGPLTGFHPLFLYESALTITGGFVALLLSRRFGSHLRDGDLASFWMIWYGSVRVVLETFREGWNWTIAGLPTAMLVGGVLIIVGAVTTVWRHRDPPAALVAEG